MTVPFTTSLPAARERDWRFCSYIKRDNVENAKKFIEFFTRPEWANRICGCYKPTVKVLDGVDILESDIVTS